MGIESVAIVGGGFSGTLLAINLLRHGGPRATLIERRPPFGKGVAYSAPTATHVLNVRAANMSAFPDAPSSFADWLGARGQGGPSTFASRRSYGDYLAGLLDEAIRDDVSGRLTLVDDNATAATISNDGVAVTLASGKVVRSDALVLATGNLPPHALPGVDEAEVGEVYVADPWSLDPGTAGEGPVLLLGTGLTMIDVALSLDDAGFSGEIVALSRRGLLPRVHAPASLGGLPERPPADLLLLLRAVRARAAEIGWRSAIDELRPFTQDLWRGASPADQSRFLRHLRPWWDVHRHRIAPDVAARIKALVASGRLQIVAGRLGRVDPGGRTTFTRRGGNRVSTANFATIVNCTGPQGDLTRTDEPLLRGLFDAGLTRPDSCRLGLDVDPDCRLIAAEGSASDRLLAVGPMTRGAFWEITAVPDIRRQAWSLARRLSNAHWVEGEGL